ncbi:MAG: hypothetical protein MJZ30_08075 [Paludibacteraceae bacterium]|nr:hypothetical protein [Paludibacteraceae bacterium]
MKMDNLENVCECECGCTEREVKSSSLFQRKMLGILCGLLAPACVLLGMIGSDNNLDGWYLSISATYYASSKICMIGLLFSAAVFFLSYIFEGYDWRDKAMSIIQAAGCLGVVVFPCRTPGAPETVGMFNLPIDISNIVHTASACVLFIAFGVNIMFLFTLGHADSNVMKRKRNRVYRICGSVIFAFCIIQALTATPVFDWVPAWFPLTWLNEFVMLVAFSVAWLVKAEMFSSLNDKSDMDRKPAMR